MISYLKSKFNEEYERLSLWYFVSFFFAIIYYFTAKPIINIALLIAITITILIIQIRYDLNLISRFIYYCLIFFIIGLITSDVRVKLSDNVSIKKIIISEIYGKISAIKPTIHGKQITLTNITSDKGNFNKIRVNVAKKFTTQLKIGDRIKFKTKLYPLQSSVLPGTFDFGFYLNMQGMEATGYALTAPKILHQQNHESFYSNFKHKINNLRIIVYNRLIDLMGDKHGNFAAAILIGETKAIDPTIAKNMRNSGIAHILSVSGLHLSLVALILYISSRAMLNLSNFLAYNVNIKVIAAIISIFGSFAYLILSGSNIAATRAFIMTLVFIISIMIGRTPYPVRSVMIAALVILLITPEYIFHPSFQLSFTAVLCLIAGYEFYIKNKNFFGNNIGFLAKIKTYILANIYSSFLASIVTAPFVIYHFYKFATYSIIMNLLAVPLMSFFMMPLALLALIFMPIGLDFIFLKILKIFIDIIINSANYITSMPGAVWHVGYITASSLLVFTIGFFWLCLWQKSWRYFGFILIMISLIMMYNTPKPDLIYDHRLKIIGLKLDNDALVIFTENKLNDFTKNYWANWYGQDNVEIFHRRISGKNHLFTTNSGQEIALGFWHCNNSDVQIVTSKKLLCKNSRVIISNDLLWLYKVILVFCDKNNCKYQHK